MDSLSSLLALVLVGLLLIWVAPVCTRSLVDMVQVRPLNSLGWGVLGFIIL